MKQLTIFLFLVIIFISCTNRENDLNKNGSNVESTIENIDFKDSTKLFGNKFLSQKSLLINDFKIFVFVDKDSNPELSQTLSVLKEKLIELSSIVPKNQLKLLKKVPICIEYKFNKDRAIWYHKSKEWVLENGYPAEIAKCVEICNMKNFLSWQKLNQPYIVLHELAHAYHDRELGLDNTEVLLAYDNALSSQIYEQVEYNLGGQKRAYALNNVEEYFAEITEAYLGINDYFPFNRSQLKDFDPMGYELMVKTWGVN